MPDLGVHSVITPAKGGTQMTVTGKSSVGGTWSTSLTLDAKNKAAHTTLAPDNKDLEFLLVWMTTDDADGTTVELTLSTQDGGKAGGSKAFTFLLDLPLLLGGASVHAIINDRKKLTATLKSGKGAEVNVFAGRKA